MAEQSQNVEITENIEDLIVDSYEAGCGACGCSANMSTSIFDSVSTQTRRWGLLFLLAVSRNIY